MIPATPNNAIEIFLQPGDFYFGDRWTRIRTLLGSCVSLIFWHPQLHLGGMCHYMLPFRPDRSMGDIDGRYGDEAVAMMFHEMRQIGTQPTEYEVKIFGGANMFPSQSRGEGSVGLRNVDAAREIVKAHGLRCVAEDTVGEGHRSVVFDVWSGDVWVRYHTPPRPQRVPIMAHDLLACPA
ncbi:MAG TPA: chemotaxis protein CheD [Rhodocyclaceae bacterium]|nr:chemotaxis protein CheD [Rhodocyclaceae bacterium]